LADVDQLAPVFQSAPDAPAHVTDAAWAVMAPKAREKTARAVAVRTNGLERDFMGFVSVLNSNTNLLNLSESVNPAIWPGSYKIDACEADATPRPNNPFQKRRHAALPQVIEFVLDEGHEGLAVKRA
jgi:hypothetical protein